MADADADGVAAGDGATDTVGVGEGPGVADGTTGFDPQAENASERDTMAKAPPRLIRVFMLPPGTRLLPPATWRAPTVR